MLLLESGQMLSKQYISFNKFSKNKCFNLNFSKIVKLKKTLQFSKNLN
jgi:hypothetical protein